MFIHLLCRFASSKTCLNPAGTETVTARVSESAKLSHTLGVPSMKWKSTFIYIFFFNVTYV